MMRRNPFCQAEVRHRGLLLLPSRARQYALDAERPTTCAPPTRPPAINEVGTSYVCPLGWMALVRYLVMSTTGIAGPDGSVTPVTPTGAGRCGIP